ncbi:hypothetical protein ACOJQI_09985 [Bacillus salacetis]|uniref:hypothetical protein n=1 Tax=Bacillus salacetis TaxID=2315464 RepID=UPI003BA04CC1
MYYYLLLFLAAIGAGLAILFVLSTFPAAAALLGGLVVFLRGLAVIVVIVFALIIIFLAIKALFNKKHC